MWYLSSSQAEVHFLTMLDMLKIFFLKSSFACFDVNSEKTKQNLLEFLF